jgi:DNA-binding transcriptional regulator/RsmH inhibitor MraZ
VEFRLAYSPDPICLTESHIKALLTQHLGNPTDPYLRQGLAKEIKDCAENFLHNVAIQSRPTPAASLRQLRRVEKAARNLRDALKWDGESLETIPDDPARTWLRQAAGWEKLTESIGDIKRLELWAQEAQEIVKKAKEAKEAAEHKPRSKHVLYVTVHRLTQISLHATGKVPGAGFSVVENIADGPFSRFAVAFFEDLRECASEKQLSDYPQLKRLLNPSRHTIRAYLKQYKKSLKGKAGKSK